MILGVSENDLYFPNGRFVILMGLTPLYQRETLRGLPPSEILSSVPSQECRPPLFLLPGKLAGLPSRLCCPMKHCMAESQ